MTSTWHPLNGPSREIALDVLIHGPLSRVELARRLDLSQGSLTRLTKPLLDDGLLVELEPQRDPRAPVGRPQRPLAVPATSHHFIGVKLTGDTAYGVLTTLRADIVTETQEPLPDHTPATVVRTITKLVRRLSDAGMAASAVGVSLGGHAQDRRTVSVAPYLDWHDVPLARLIEEAIGVPTVVENDLVSLTEAESWFGAGRGLQQFAVVTIGAGVGFGLVVRGHQVVNFDLGLGLVGHVPLDPSGPVCFAGHRGCATALLTTGSIAGAASVALGRALTYDEVLDLAIEGDPAATRVVDEAARALGRMLALAANFTMPEKIVVCGEGIRLLEITRATVEATLTAERDPRAAPVPLELRPGSFTQWARGAAVIAIQTYVLGPG